VNVSITIQGLNQYLDSGSGNKRRKVNKQFF